MLFLIYIIIALFFLQMQIFLFACLPVILNKAQSIFTVSASMLFHLRKKHYCPNMIKVIKCQQPSRGDPIPPVSAPIGPGRGVFSRRMSLKKRILSFFRLRRKLCEAFSTVCGVHTGGRLFVNIGLQNVTGNQIGPVYVRICLLDKLLEILC